MIRKYRDTDFEDVFALQEVYLYPCSREELQSRVTDSWVYEKEGKVIGSVICSDLNIWSITVAPEHQRQGIGGELLSVLGDEEHSLYVDAANPAISLYKKHGYTAVKILKDYYGVGMDAIFMTRPAKYA